MGPRGRGQASGGFKVRLRPVVAGNAGEHFLIETQAGLGEGSETGGRPGVPDESHATADSNGALVMVPLEELVECAGLDLVFLLVTTGVSFDVTHRGRIDLGFLVSPVQGVEIGFLARID